MILFEAIILQTDSIKPCWQMTREEYMKGYDLNTKNLLYHGSPDKWKMIGDSIKRNGKLSDYLYASFFKKRASEYGRGGDKRVLVLNIRNGYVGEPGDVGEEGQDWKYNEFFDGEKLFVDHYEIIKYCKFRFPVPQELIDFYSKWKPRGAE